MGNRNDGGNKKPRIDIRYEGSLLYQKKTAIQEALENGNFTEKEQKEIAGLKKAIKEHGGLRNLQTDDVDKILDVIKILGSAGDKTTMEKEEIGDILKNISKIGRTPT